VSADDLQGDVSSEPGEKQSLSFTVTPTQMSLIDKGKRVIEPGEFEINVGGGRQLQPPKMPPFSRDDSLLPERLQKSNKLLAMAYGQRGGSHDSRSKDHLEEPISRFDIERLKYSVLFERRILVL